MARYLVLWEVDSSKVPTDQQERIAAFSWMLDLVEKDMQAGFVKDWGTYIGELAGYAVCEATELEVEAMCQQYIPMVEFTVRGLTTVEEQRRLLESAPK